MSIWEHIKDDELIFELPLYKKIEIDWKNMKKEPVTRRELLYEDMEIYNEYDEYITYITEEYKKLLEFITSTNKIYGKCPTCKKNMVFGMHSGADLGLDYDYDKVIQYENKDNDTEVYLPDAEKEMKIKIENLIRKAGYFCKKFHCEMCKETYFSAFKILFENEKLYLIKIGQYPSLHKFSKYDSSAYNNLLEKMNAKDDFRNAIKMSIDGYHIAAYTYLRRVLEKIILKIFDENKSELKCELNSFKSKHMDEKIDMLKDYMPQFLYENKYIYSIVSAGIHTLEEDECFEYFETLKTSIEIILNQYEAKRKEKNLLKNTSNKLGNINTEVKSILKN